jgi:hypothetical protein
MKTFPRFFFVAGALLVGSLSARAERTTSFYDDWLALQPIASTNQALPLDQALAALSRNGAITVLADATNLPIGVEVQPDKARLKNAPQDKNSSRAGVIGSISAQAKLSYDRVGSSTFVFWPEPDVEHTINLLAGRQKQLAASYLPPSETTRTALEEFFTQNLGWNPKHATLADVQKRAQGADKGVKIGDLPPELRAQVQGEFVQQLRVAGTTPDYHQLEVSGWKDARLRFDQQRYNIYDKNGLITHQEPVFVLYAYFPSSGRTDVSHAYIGAPHAANPHQVALANFEMPSWVSEEGRLSKLQAEEPAAPVAPGEPLATLDLDAQAELAKNITLPAKRLGLRALVQSIGQQIGVTLSVAPGVAPKAQVLACSPGTPASAAMSGLARLYGARWVKNDGGYLLQPELDEVHQTLSHWGLWTLYNHDVHPYYERDAVGAQVADEVVDALGRDQLLAKQGAAFSDLPADTQAHVVQHFREQKAGDLLIFGQRLEDGLKYINDMEVRLSPLPKTTPLLFGAFHSPQAETGFLSQEMTGFGAYTPDGRFIIPLFPKSFVNNAAEMQLAGDQEKMRLALHPDPPQNQEQAP